MLTFSSFANHGSDSYVLVKIISLVKAEIWKICFSLWSLLFIFGTTTFATQGGLNSKFRLRQPAVAILHLRILWGIYEIVII